jgi:hypothetical protein
VASIAFTVDTTVDTFATLAFAVLAVGPGGPPTVLLPAWLVWTPRLT